MALSDLITNTEKIRHLASIIDIFYNYLNLIVVTVQHAMEWSRKVFNFVTLSLNSVGS